MKRFIVTSIIIFTAYLAQTTLMADIRIAGVVPNLLLVVVALVGYINGRTQGMITGLILGLIYDCQYAGVIGLYALFYMCLGYVNGICHKIFFRDDYTLPVIMVTASSLALGFMTYVFEFLLRSRLNFNYYLRNIIVPETVYTVFIAVLLLKPMLMIYGWAKRVKEKEVTNA